MTITPQGLLAEWLVAAGKEDKLAGFEVDNDRLERFLEDARRDHGDETEEFQQAWAVYVALTHPGWDHGRLADSLSLVDSDTSVEPPSTPTFSIKDLKRVVADAIAALPKPEVVEITREVVVPGETRIEKVERLVAVTTLTAMDVREIVADAFTGALTASQVRDIFRQEIADLPEPETKVVTVETERVVEVAAKHPLWLKILVIVALLLAVVSVVARS